MTWAPLVSFGSVSPRMMSEIPVTWNTSEISALRVVKQPSSTLMTCSTGHHWIELDPPFSAKAAQFGTGTSWFCVDGLAAASMAAEPSPEGPAG
jgi:hypothetical protein